MIGAGPAGLAVAATLRQRGLSCVVLERATSVGSSWQGRYDLLHLHTIRWLSGLPGGRIPRRFGRWVSRDDFVRYLRRLRAAIRRAAGIRGRRQPHRSQREWLAANDFHRHSGRLGGGGGHRLQPGSAPAGLARSGPFHRDPVALGRLPGTDRVPGQQVLVVGAGNSAAEIAVQLADAGATVTQSVRTPPNIVRRDTLGIPSQLFSIALKHAPRR